MFRRREFISLFASAAAAWPIGARAEQALKIRQLGMLLPRAGAGEQESVAAGMQKLGELGWRDGENVQIDQRLISTVDAEHLRAQATDLVGIAPVLIWALSNPVLAALQQTTRNIPI